MTYRDELELDDGTLDAGERLYLNPLRIIAGFLVAPGLAAIAFAAIMPVYSGLPYPRAVLQAAILYATVGAYPTAVLIGVPTYLALRRHVRARLRNSMLAGALVATLPWSLIGLLSRSESASINGTATVIDGMYTAYGWLEFGGFLLLVAGVGAVGGAVFWSVVTAGLGRRNRQD